MNVVGNVTAFYSSDHRLKENVQLLPNAITNIKQIRGVSFDWTEAFLEDNLGIKKHDIGVIAQEIEKVLPEVVATRDDGFKAVKYDRIVALLIEGIKEQQDYIETLEQRIQKIETFVYLNNKGN